MGNKSRRWVRWVSLGACDLERLVWIARQHGMRVIDAYNPSFCFWYELALYGTSEQMRATEAAWKAAGESGGDEHEIRNRRPPGGFGLIRALPQEEWLENTLEPLTDKPQGRCRESGDE